MLLKRIYDHAAPRPEGTPPPVTGVVIKSAPDHQHFSPALLETGQQEGWLTRAGNLLHITGTAGVVTYQIVAPPGYYCCHCDRPVDDGKAARAHLAAAHAGAASPDPTNPTGYRKDNFYATVRVKTPLPPAEAEAQYRQRRRALLQALGAKFRRGEG